MLDKLEVSRHFPLRYAPSPEMPSYPSPCSRCGVLTAEADFGAIGGRAGNCFGERKETMVFDLAEVLRPEQFLGAEDLRALFQRAFGKCKLLGEVPFRILATAHLREANLDDRRRGHPSILLARLHRGEELAVGLGLAHL